MRALRGRVSRGALASFGALSLILAIAAALRLWGWEYGLPHPRARPDEEFVLESIFQMFARNRRVPLTYIYPHLPFYIDVAILHLYFKIGQLLGNYDKTFDMLFDIVVLRPGLHYRLIRLSSVALGVATVGATYALGKISFGKRRVGLLAALLVATCVLHVITSRFATVDCMMTFFVTLALIFSVRAAQDHKVSSFVAAGVFVGLSTASKYNAVFVCFALVVPVVFALFSVDRSKRRALVGKLVLAGACSFVAFALTSPYVLLRFEALQGAIAHIDRNLRGATGELALVVHLRDTFRLGLGWPFYLSALAGVVRGFWCRRPAELAMLGFAIPFYLSMAGVQVSYPRYVVPMVPVLAVLSAGVVTTLVSRFRVAVAVAFIVILVAPGVWSSTRFDQLAARKDTRILATDWIGEHLPRRSRIGVCEGYGAVKINADRRRPPAFEPIEMTCSVTEVRGASVRYLVTHEHPSLGQSLPTDLVAMLQTEGRVLARFDPFSDNRADGEPYFYRDDAFYLPIAGFGALERGGPIVTIWQLGRK